MLRTPYKRGNRRGTSDPFPMAEFKRLLKRYCREHFTREQVEEHAIYGTPEIGVYIGDEAGALNRPIIDGVMAAGILSACKPEEGGEDA